MTAASAGRDSPLRRAAFLVVALFVGSLAWGNQVIGPFQVIQLMATLAVVAVLLADATLLRLRVLPWQVGIPLAAMVVCAALASVATPVPDLSFRINVALVLGGLLVVTIWSIVDTKSRLLVLVRLLVFSGAIVGAVSLIELGDLSVAAGGAVVTGRVVGVFSQPNELGVFAAMLLPLAVALALARPGRQRVLALLGALAIALALLLSLSRGAWFGGAAGIVSLALLTPARKRLWIPLTAGGLTVGVFSVLLAPPTLVHVVSQRVETIVSGSGNPYDERHEIYAEAGRQIVDSPLVGHGPGAFSMTARTLTQDGYDLRVEHAHSLVLVIATDYGGLGVLALFALSLGLMWLLHQSVWKGRDHATDESSEIATVAAGLFAGLVAVAAHGVIDYPLRNPVTGMTAWLVIALTVAATRCARLLVDASDAEDLST